VAQLRRYRQRIPLPHSLAEQPTHFTKSTHSTQAIQTIQTTQPTRQPAIHSFMSDARAAAAVIFINDHL